MTSQIYSEYLNQVTTKSKIFNELQIFLSVRITRYNYSLPVRVHDHEKKTHLNYFLRAKNI